MSFFKLFMSSRKRNNKRGGIQSVRDQIHFMLAAEDALRDEEIRNKYRHKVPVKIKSKRIYA